LCRLEDIGRHGFHKPFEACLRENGALVVGKGVRGGNVGNNVCVANDGNPEKAVGEGINVGICICVGVGICVSVGNGGNVGNAVKVGNGIGELKRGPSNGSPLGVTFAAFVVVLSVVSYERVPQEARKTMENIQKYCCGVNLIVIVIHPKSKRNSRFRPSNSLYPAVVTALLQGCHNFVTTRFYGN